MAYKIKTESVAVLFCFQTLFTLQQKQILSLKFSKMLFHITFNIEL